MQSVKLVSSVTNELRKLFINKDPNTAFPTRIQHSFTPIDSSPSFHHTKATQIPFISNNPTNHSQAEASRCVSDEMFCK